MDVLTHMIINGGRKVTLSPTLFKQGGGRIIIDDANAYLSNGHWAVPFDAIDNPDILKALISAFDARTGVLDREALPRGYKRSGLIDSFGFKRCIGVLDPIIDSLGVESFTAAGIFAASVVMLQGLDDLGLKVEYAKALNAPMIVRGSVGGPVWWNVVGVDKPVLCMPELLRAA